MGIFLRNFLTGILEGRRTMQYAVTSAVSLATITMGVTLGWLTPMLPKILKNETSITVNDDESFWILTLSSLGALIGSLVTLIVCDRFGRRPTILLSAVFFLVGTIFAAFATQAWMLCVVQTLWGISSGILNIVVTIYIAEISEPDIRGRLCVVTRVMCYFGILAIVGIGFMVSYRALNYSLPLLPLVYFAACYSMPESPYYLLKRGNIEQARKELLRLRGNSSSSESELEQMLSHVKKETQYSSSIFELFWRKKYRRAIIIVYGLRLTQLMSATVTFEGFYYDIIEESNVDIKFSTSICIYQAVHIAAGILAATLVDIVGRRRLLIFSYIGVSICLATVGLYFYLRDVVLVYHKFLRYFGLVTFIGLHVFLFMTSIGIDSLSGVLEGELFPINVRVTAIGALNVFAGIGFPLSKFFQYIKESTGKAGILWVYALIAVIGAVFMYFVVLETKGKSLEEIQDMIQGDRQNGSGEELTNMEERVERRR